MAWIGIVSVTLFCLTHSGWGQSPAAAPKPKTTAQKLTDIILPEVVFQDASVSTILDYLSREGEKHDPEKIGINIVVLAQVAADEKYTLRLKNVTMAAAFNFVTQMTGLKYRVEPNAVIFFRELPARDPSPAKVLLPPARPVEAAPPAKASRPVAPAAEDSPAAAIRKAEVFEAAQKNDVIALEKLLSESPSLLNARNRQDETPVFVAAKAGNLGVVELLIKRGAALDVTCGRNYDAKTPLIAAMGGFHQRDDGRGRFKVVETLLNRGADPNEPDNDGRTPLWHAVSWRMPASLVELLIRKGGDISKAGRRGDTPLHVAAAGNMRGTVELLLARGADPRAKDSNGETPVEVAANAGHVELAKFLQTAPKRSPAEVARTVADAPRPPETGVSAGPAIKQLPISSQLKLIVDQVRVKSSNERYLSIQLKNTGMNHLTAVIVRWKSTGGGFKHSSFDDETSINLKPLERIDLQSHKFYDTNLRYLVEVLVNGELAASVRN